MPAPGDLKTWAYAHDVGEQGQLPYAPAIISAYGVTVESASLGGVPVLSVTPQGWVDDGRILIYVHGGAFTFLSARSILFESGLMANRSGMKVVSVDYTPAPAARWREITDQVIAVYQVMLKSGHEPDEIGLWGDSAGGSVAAGATLKLQQNRINVHALYTWAAWI